MPNLPDNARNTAATHYGARLYNDNLAVWSVWKAPTYLTKSLVNDPKFEGVVDFMLIVVHY